MFGLQGFGNDFHALNRRFLAAFAWWIGEACNPSVSDVITTHQVEQCAILLHEAFERLEAKP